MSDVVSSEKRSRMMSGIRGKDTKPELAVRRYLHSRGYRFRLHRKDLPGRPDIVLPKYNAAIFVHGCFWHRHKDCRFAYNPKSKIEFWQAKFAGNVKRDEEARQALLDLGWRVMLIWECGLRSNAVREQGIEAISEWLESDWATGEYPPNPA
jgi:DNA mismatch endonuclease (patch repair protein)